MYLTTEIAELQLQWLRRPAICTISVHHLLSETFHVAFRHLVLCGQAPSEAMQKRFVFSFVLWLMTRGQRSMSTSKLKSITQQYGVAAIASAHASARIALLSLRAAISLFVYIVRCYK